LGEPLVGGDVLEQHDALTAIEQYFVIAARDRLPPPFVIDAPALEDGFDDCAVDRVRTILRVALDGDGLGDVQGSKSISA